MSWAGKVFWYADDDSEEEHLYVVVNEPSEVVSAVVVNFTDYHTVEHPPINIDIGRNWYRENGSRQFRVTTKKTTLYHSLAFTVSLEDLESSTEIDICGDLCHRLLKLVRDVMCTQIHLEQKVSDALEPLCSNWEV